MIVKITLTDVGTDISNTLDLYSNETGSWTFVENIPTADIVAGYTFVAPISATAYQLRDVGNCGTILELSCTVIPLECTTLGNAANFVVLGSSTVTNTHSSVVTGNLGLSPGTSVTGFPPGVIIGIEHVADGAAAAAKVSAQAAYDCLHTLTPATRLVAELGGTTQTTGVYDFASSAQITGILTLNGGGNSNATFVFIIPSTLTTATSASVVLTNSAQAGNVYWIVGSSATIGTSTTMIGNIIANDSITMVTSATLDGRAFALTAAVTLDTNTIIGHNCTINPCATTTSTTTELL